MAAIVGRDAVAKVAFKLRVIVVAATFDRGVLDRATRLPARRDVTRVAGLTDSQIETLVTRLERRELAEN